MASAGVLDEDLGDRRGGGAGRPQLGREKREEEPPLVVVDIEEQGGS